MLRVLTLLAALAFLWAAPASATTSACTAGCTQYHTNSVFSGTSISVTTSGVVAGHGLHIYYCGQGPTAYGSVTVNGSAATVGGTTSLGGSNLCGAAFFANAPSGNYSVAVATTGACTNCSIWVGEWADSAAATLDAMATTYTSGANTNAPCGSMTPATAGDTIDAVIYQPQNVTPTIQNGFAASFTSSTNTFGAFKTGAASGVQTPTPFLSGVGSFDNSVMCLAITQPGGGGGSGTFRALLGVGR